jgi:uroporphyrinogen-III synthase
VIPAIVPPLTGLSVLVTRPQPQAATLAAGIAAFGGDPIVFPSIAIEAIEVSSVEPHDLVVFISVHAVEHGARFIQKTETVRIAAIGSATASALAAANLPANIVPLGEPTSESLLEHPELKTLTTNSVLIVRGEGGRETLREAFLSRGSIVNTLEVYRRVTAQVTPIALAALEARWAEGDVDVVTATSIETYLKLEQLLTERGRELLRDSRLLAPTQRIIDAAIANGWRGDALISGGADDRSILGTLARWRARARVMPR